MMNVRFAALALSFASCVFAAEVRLGKPLTLETPVSLKTLFAGADALAGKTVQVVGKVTEVCEMAGCWMSLTDAEGHLLRIKVDDGVIVFPKTAVGRTAIAEGKLEKFFQESCLMEQSFIKDPAVTIKDLLAQKIAKIGENMNIRRFTRYQLGEA